MRIVCWQTILIKYHTFFRKLGKMSQNLSSAAVVIGALRVNVILCVKIFESDCEEGNIYLNAKETQPF